MQVDIRQEAGYDLALYGFSLSYKDRAIRPEDWWLLWKDDGIEVYDKDDEVVKRYIRIEKAAKANAGRGKGHDKFLRQIILWVDIEAPRYWWSEFDTYKVGTVAQSESTMHTLSRRYMNIDDCTYTTYTRRLIEAQIKEFNKIVDEGSVQEIKMCVPESYLQRRLVTMNYAVLACIITQRKSHFLPEWSLFIDSIYEQCEHKELLPDYKEVISARRCKTSKKI
jgi:hypothetical protein